jgi:Uma2 family endonuclease
MGEAAAKLQMSPEEYLAFERVSELRHEYVKGEVFAMAGGSREHSLTATNILGELRAALLDRPCEVHGSDMRVKSAATGRYVYPDASVVCGRAKFEDTSRDTLLNPIVIVEVLSDSTEGYDRGDKFAHYESIPSVQDYVIASQKEARIDHFHRLPDGSWNVRILRKNDVLALDAIQCRILVERAYLKVFDLPPADEE